MTGDEAMVLAADRRAKITALLNRENKRMSVGEIADAVELDRAITGKLCKDMADQALIKTDKQGTSKFYWTGDAAPPENSKQQSAATHKKPRKTATPADDDIELVIGGSTITIGRNSGNIVVGRNPATGRIRITIDDNKE